jgi:hypothetical protein
MIRFPQACCQIPSTSQFFRHRNPYHFFCDFTSSSSPTCGAVFKTFQNPRICNRICSPFFKLLRNRSEMKESIGRFLGVQANPSIKWGDPLCCPFCESCAKIDQHGYVSKAEWYPSWYPKFISGCIVDVYSPQSYGHRMS